MRRIQIITASTSPERVQDNTWTWITNAANAVFHHVVYNGIEGEPYLGVVPAFAKGLQELTLQSSDLIAMFHDDLLIHEFGWDSLVQIWFDRRPETVMAGFFGSQGLGADDLYKTSYKVEQLARDGGTNYSNMTDAEAHGRRTTEPTPVVVLDGFSAVMRADFALWAWGQLERLGIVHHAYDLALGCLAARWRKMSTARPGARIGEPQDGEVWMLPVSCTHLGGQTAVGDPGYQEWAKSQILGGDVGFHRQAHEICYNEFRDILPLRLW